MKSKKAIITGITGQDGSYLTELLLNKGYEVHGIIRRSSNFNTHRLEHVYEGPFSENKKLFLHYGDLLDASSLSKIINYVQPNEIYNLGAQSHVGVSFDQPIYSSDVNALGTLRILESIKSLNLEKKVKFYQASTSEIFGNTEDFPQSEKSKFYPRSPYAISKLFAYWITVNYREAYGMFACNGILFNHESPRRGKTFVTRKVTRTLVNITLGTEKCLYVGNLDSKRDWGHAKDFVRMQWLMLQQSNPDDFIIATGKQYSVRELINTACKILSIEIKFSGSGSAEIGTVVKSPKNNKFMNIGDIIIRIDKKYLRPTETDSLQGDFKKAKDILGWKPKISFTELIKEMIMNDIHEANLESVIDMHRDKEKL
tara:strand:- start:10568 stop:11677 length:1110 start_codon:yes stop_codon:yes gene_type:complete